MTHEKRLPPRNERKPKRIKVRIHRPTTFDKKLTYHVYGKRPKRGQFVRIKGGEYAGRRCEVVRGWSLYSGATWLAELSKPKEWT